MPLDAVIAPPPPPVYFDRGRDDRDPRENPFFLPSLFMSERKTVWRGMYTIHYKIMDLWDYCHLTVTDADDVTAVQRLWDANLPIVRRCPVSDARYWQWIDRWHPAGEIMPHIQWGGHLRSIPGGDGGKGYRAWQIYALGLGLERPMP